MFKKLDKKKIVAFLMLNLGLLMVAFGIVVFRNPNQFASGGVSGFALLMTHFFPSLPVGAISLVINVFLLLIGYAVLGKSKSIGSVYGTLMLSAMIMLLLRCPSSLPRSSPMSRRKCGRWVCPWAAAITPCRNRC